MIVMMSGTVYIYICVCMCDCDVCNCVYICVLQRWRNGKAAGADTLEAVVISLHAGDPGHRVALYWNEAAVEFGSPLGV